MKTSKPWNYIWVFLLGVLAGALARHISGRSATNPRATRALPPSNITLAKAPPLPATSSIPSAPQTSRSATISPIEPPAPMEVTVWGPPEPKKTKPVGMGDVVLGFVYSQLFAAIPALFVLTLAANAIAPGASYQESETALTSAISSGPMIVLTMLLSWAGWMTAVWWAGTHKGDKDWRALLKWRFKPSRDIPIGIGIAVVFRTYELGVNALLQALGVDTESLTNTSTITSQTGIWLVLLALGAAIGAPLVEEIFFRGMFLSVAVRNYGKVAAVVITSIVFGLMHVQPTLGGTLVIVTQTTIIGVVLALLVLKTNRIGPAIFTHLAINISGVALALIFLT